MEKQRRISKTEANQFLNDLGKPVYRTSAACNYDSVRTAFDEASRLVYKCKFPEERKPRKGSLSFMDPLRDALNRFSRTSSEEELPRRTRSASSADITRITLTRAEPVLRDNNEENNVEKKSVGFTLKENFLQIPTTDDAIGLKRFRSHSFT